MQKLTQINHTYQSILPTLSIFSFCSRDGGGGGLRLPLVTGSFWYGLTKAAATIVSVSDPLSSPEDAGEIDESDDIVM